MRITIIVLCLVLSIPTHAEVPKNVSTSGGRFQLIQLSHMRRDQFLLDTQTGKIWIPTCLAAAKAGGADCNYQAWQLEDIQDITLGNKSILEKAAQIRKAVAD